MHSHFESTKTLNYDELQIKQLFSFAPSQDRLSKI